jgi:hypothetical protein
MPEPTNSDLVLAYGQQTDFLRNLVMEQYACEFGTVGGGPNGNGTYPMTLMTGEVIMRKCPAQIAFDAASMPVVKLVGSSNLVLTAAHNGCKVLAFNGTLAVNLTMGPDIRTGFSCMVQQYQTAKIHFLAGNTAVLHSYPAGYEYTAGRYANVSVMCDEAPAGINQINLAGQLSNLA